MSRQYDNGLACDCKRKQKRMPIAECTAFDALSRWVDHLGRALLYIGLGMALCLTIVLSAMGLTS